MSIQNRQRIEVAVVRLLLKRALLAGFTTHAIDDGESVTRVKTHERALEEVFNRDECYIKFRNAEKKEFWARIILGNDSDDCISDHGTDDGPFDQMMAEVSALASHGTITFTACKEAHPAYNVGESNRGACINCGSYHVA